MKTRCIWGFSALVLCGCNVQDNIVVPEGGLDVMTFPMSAIGEDVSGAIEIPYDSVTNTDTAFSLSIKGELLLMTKANCQPEDLPYYVILHIIPEDPGKLTQPERGFNNEDFKPDIFTDNDICMTLTYAPNYRVKNVKIGQYESRLGSRWSAQVNVAAFNAAIGQ